MPLDPEWLEPDIILPPGGEIKPTEPKEPAKQPEPTEPILAPPSRFRSAHSSFSKYKKNHDASDLKKSIGRYVAKGKGGAKRFAKSLAPVITTAYGFLNHLNEEKKQNSNFAELLSNKEKSREVFDKILTEIGLQKGTLVSETIQECLTEAWMDFYDLQGNINKLLSGDELAIADFLSMFFSKFIANTYYQDMDLGRWMIDMPVSERDKTMTEIQDFVSISLQKK